MKSAAHAHVQSERRICECGAVATVFPRLRVSDGYPVETTLELCLPCAHSINGFRVVREAISSSEAEVR